MNGAELMATPEDKYVRMLSLAEGSLSEADFAAWLRGHIHADASGGVHEGRGDYGA